MADNVAITAGSGTSIKTDQVGTDHYQVIKLADGTADSSAVVAVDIGVKANALRVAPASDITDATYIGDIKFGEALPAGTAAIGKLAANDGVDIGNVDVASIAAGTNLIGKVSIDQVTANANEVVVKSGTVTAVTNITNAVAVTNAGITTIAGAVAGTEMQVDVVAALPAGDNNVGNVDIVTHPSDTFAADTAAYGKGVLCQGDDGTDRRAILVGTDGHVQVDVLAAPSTAVTNAGTFAVQAACTLGAETTKVIGTVNIAAAQTIAVTNAGTFATQVDGAALTALQLIDNMISGSEAQVDVVAALPAGTNNIGDVDVATIAAGDNNIGNVDVASMPTGANGAQVQGTVAAGSAAANNPVLLGAKSVNAFPAVVDTADVNNVLADLHGRLIVAVEAPNDLLSVGQTATVTTTTSTTVLATAGASTKWRISAVGAYNSHATVGTWVSIQDSTATPVVYWRGYCAPVGGGFNLNFSPALAAVGTASGSVIMRCETAGAEVGVSVQAYKVPA